MTPYGGLLLLAVPVLLLVVYLWKGALKIGGPLTGRKILRLTSWDRAIHWATALTWLVLAITGILIMFGKHVVIPIFGYTLFSWLAALSKNLHNFIGPLFLVSATLMFFTYVKRNIPRSYDWTWLVKLGGLPSRRARASGFLQRGREDRVLGGAHVIYHHRRCVGVGNELPELRSGPGTHAER